MKKARRDSTPKGRIPYIGEPGSEMFEACAKALARNTRDLQLIVQNRKMGMTNREIMSALQNEIRDPATPENDTVGRFGRKTMRKALKMLREEQAGP